MSVESVEEDNVTGMVSAESEIEKLGWGWWRYWLFSVFVCWKADG